MKRLDLGPRPLRSLYRTRSLHRTRRKQKMGAIGLLIFGVLLFSIGFYAGMRFAREGVSRSPGGIQRPLPSPESILEAPRRVYGDSGMGSEGEVYGDSGRDAVYGDAIYEIEVTRTAYNPVVGQTDNSPCIGAFGDNVCELTKKGIRVLAASPDLNLRRGTRVILEGQVYYVYDRMPSRWVRSVDILTFSREEAMQIGRQQVTITVVKNQ